MKNSHQILSRNSFGYALERGRPFDVDAFLRSGRDPNEENSNGMRPLHFAGQRGDLACVIALLDLRADPNKTLRNGITPLFFAASEGHENVVRALISARANPHISRSDGCTPFLIAVEQGKTAVVRILLDLKIDSPTGSKENDPPIYIAAKQGHESLVRMLAEAKADLNAAGKIGLKPLHIAADCGHRHIVRALIDLGVDPDTVDNVDHRRPLHFAVSRGDKAAIYALLALGADHHFVADDPHLLPQQKENFYQVFTVAVSLNILKPDKTILSLFQRALDVAEKMDEKYLPLFKKLPREIFVDLRRLQILRGARVGLDHRDEKTARWTALHVAAQNGDDVIISALGELWHLDLDKKIGIDPNIDIPEVPSPLHLATKQGHSAAVRALIQVRANANTYDKTYGKTPLEMAVSQGHTEIEALLRAEILNAPDEQTVVEEGHFSLSATKKARSCFQ